MITSLSIENFALIEKLNIDFSKGFSIITGETGAGKSILLGALGLVLGKRADLSSLKNKEEKCIVEAVFEIGPYDLQWFFDENDLDYELETIIRREILPSGKSRAFVNDSPVNLQQLQDLSQFLIDVHSQHQTLDLAEEAYQFKIIDALAANQEFITSYVAKLKQFRSAKSDLESKQSTLSTILKEKDYNEFLFNELQAANLKAGELEDLEKSYAALNNVELIKDNLSMLLALANDEQFGLLKNLKEFKAILQKNSGFSAEYQALSDRAQSVAIEFDDIVVELSKESDSVFSDPEKLELINQKLQLIYALQKKHQVITIEELIDIQNELESKVVSVVNLEEEIIVLQKTIENIEAELDVISTQISLSRSEAIPGLTHQLVQIL
uniref:AAA family ATPase n=1 Tax=Flavobacterium sp. TaxID=239 RepID=UPI0037834EB6